MQNNINTLKCYLINCKQTIVNLKNRIFNKSNINKVLIIFVIGFISRILVNYIYGVNVFVDYLNIISCIYYILFSVVIVTIHEIVGYYDINIIPFKSLNSIISFTKDTLIFLVKISYNIKIIPNTNISLEELKLSSLKRIFLYLFNDLKVSKLNYLANYEQENSNSTNKNFIEDLILNRKDKSSISNGSSDTSNNVSNFDNSYSIASTSEIASARESTQRNVGNNYNNTYYPLVTSASYNPNNIRNSNIPRLSNNSFNYTPTGSTGIIQLAHYPNVISNTPRLATVPITGNRSLYAESIYSMPNTPILSNLTTPEAMTPLFSSNENFEDLPVNSNNNNNIASVNNEMNSESINSDIHSNMATLSITDSNVTKVRPR